MSNALVNELLRYDGVEEVHVEKVVNVTHKKTATGETDESFNEIRERVVPEEAFGALAEDLGWEHHGTIDVIGDYHLKDRFVQRRSFGDDE